MTVKAQIEYASPQEVTSSLGGMKVLKKAAKSVEEEPFFERFGEAVTEAYIRGQERGTWVSQATMATRLDVSESCIKRLMAARNKPGYIRGMKYGDVLRVARGLGIREETLWPDDAEKEAGALRGVVAMMRQFRQERGEDLSKDGFGEPQYEAVLQLTKLIDGGELPAWRVGESFAAWVARILAAWPGAHLTLPGTPADPPWKNIDIVVAAGDWTSGRTCLSFFVERLCCNARAILEDRRLAPHLVGSARDLFDGLLQINQLITAYRKTKNGSLAKIAKELKEDDENVLLARLEQVGLLDADLRSPDAEEGCLLMKSEKYRALAEDLLALNNPRPFDAPSQERKAR